MRFQEIKIGNDIYINDAYNASPMSMKAAIHRRHAEQSRRSTISLLSRNCKDRGCKLMKLHELNAPAGSRSGRKRKGRGTATGQGKTAGRGMNGQNSRSGGGVRLGFEGGQMPLYRRLPKRGFNNKWARASSR